MSSTTRGSDAKRIVFKNPWWMTWLLAIFGFFVGLVGLGYIIERPERGPRWFSVLAGALLAIWGCWGFMIRARGMISFLTDRSYVERAIVRRRTIPLADIVEIVAPGSYGRLVVRLTSGRRVRLFGVPVRGKHRDRALTMITEAVSQARSEGG